MYIVAIGWLYVILMMAITAKSFVAGVFTFVAYGLGPVALVLWLMGSPLRKKRKVLGNAADQPLDAGDGTDA
jgi:sulfite exporter TauE/SafE